MKKVLFATTALVATAGMAAAEVTMSGQARFGLYYDGEDTSLDQRFRLTFTGITESDNGVKFEARVRIETNENSTRQLGGCEQSNLTNSRKLRSSFK